MKHIKTKTNGVRLAHEQNFKNKVNAKVVELSSNLTNEVLTLNIDIETRNKICSVLNDGVQSILDELRKQI